MTNTCLALPVCLPGLFPTGQLPFWLSLVAYLNVAVYGEFVGLKKCCSDDCSGDCSMILTVRSLPISEALSLTTSNQLPNQLVAVVSTSVVFLFWKTNYRILTFAESDQDEAV